MSPSYSQLLDQFSLSALNFLIEELEHPILLHVCFLVGIEVLVASVLKSFYRVTAVYQPVKILQIFLQDIQIYPTCKTRILKENRLFLIDLPFCT